MLTPHETEFMELLWQCPEGLTRTEVLKHSQKRSWKNSTFHLLVNSLLEKEMIKVVGERLSGRRYSRVFAPAVPREFYQERFVADTLNATTNADMLHLCSAFIKSATLSEDERMELIRLLQDENEEDTAK